MNWYVHGRTERCVGFGQQGGVCEGDHCEHLNDGDQAYGYSGEADSMGSELNLMCKDCFNEFMEKRKIEPEDCDDCGGEFPRNELRTYTSYSDLSEGVSADECRLWLCKACLVAPTHARRVENDDYLRDQDSQDLDDWDPRLEDDGCDDDEPDEEDHGEDHVCTGQWCKGCEFMYGKHYWDCTVFVRGKVSGIHPNRVRWSRGIQRITVGGR